MRSQNAFYELADKLESLDKLILSMWEQSVRDNLEHDKKESKVILLNHMPEILKSLSHTLRSGIRNDMELARAHGFQRAILTKYTIDDILSEYAIFRETLITYVYPIGDLECVKFVHWYIDCLAKHSVLEFIQHLELTGRTISPATKPVIISDLPQSHPGQ